ncbi:MAG: tetratricopeptide repeat protein, partial [Candidatus Obscuribacterales bacterium]|nr:tetratricopeptide repeat protein [Candidatus Obscuribacterales bacterium]
ETACLFDASDVPSSEKLGALRRKLDLENSTDKDDDVAKLTQELNQASTSVRKAYFYRKRAEVYQQRQNHAMAIADFTRALELDPTQNWLLCDIAYARYMTGDYKGTITDCDTIIAKNFDPTYRSGAYMYRGWALERLNRLPSALDSYNSGLRCNPNDVSVLWARARLLEQMGKVNEALYDYRQAIEIGQLLPTVNKDYIEQVQRDLDRASDSFSIESEDEPFTPDPQYYYTDLD